MVAHLRADLVGLRGRLDRVERRQLALAAQVSQTSDALERSVATLRIIGDALGQAADQLLEVRQHLHGEPVLGDDASEEEHGPPAGGGSREGGTGEGVDSASALD